MATSPKTDLKALRDRLDEIDTGLHRLLRERFEIVAEIGLTKGPDETVIRPAREAAVIENRLAGHTGKLPREVLAHVFRVLVAASCAVQRPFTVHVAGALEAARFLYGSVPTLQHAGPGAALAAMAPGDIAVIDGATNEAWWAHRGEAHAIVRARLSDGGSALVLGGPAVARGTGPAALVVRAGACQEVATGSIEAEDDVIGRYHPFPIELPVAS